MLRSSEAMGKEAGGGGDDGPGRPRSRRFRLAALIPEAVKSRLTGHIRNVAVEAKPSFPELAYRPYRPGESYVLPAPASSDPDRRKGELPIPPERLWLGYDYRQAGAEHVAKMLEVVRASGFSFDPGDRILDLGCGAGRMIRHLEDLAESCEIWGTDISAEHIFWCREHLSPPFNFATTTKVPHLPFEDRSFRLIYCGSLFTHIDDLADAWLLELQRILAPDGRLYVTIHDKHTLELFEDPRYDAVRVVRHIKSFDVYQRSKRNFGMMTLGRDHVSQVFYDIAFFAKMVRPLFDVLSVTEEAYHSQTAVLLARKGASGGSQVG
ncbi:MAG TPA: methyltransferase domain-containing protein [Allosphingosinicella sp.]|nr:methyltransferase domain-containing protein [Allosphingosinicella sp.]